VKNAGSERDESAGIKSASIAGKNTNLNLSALPEKVCEDKRVV